MKPIRFKTKYNLYPVKLGVFLFLALLICVPFLLNFINKVFNSYEMYFQSPIIITTQKIFVIKKKPTAVPIALGSIARAAGVEEFDPYKLPIEDYICFKFDKDCKLALAVARAESGLRQESLNLNKGHSLDVGIFQVNEYYHGDKQGCSLKDLVDEYKNVDCAYSIYLEQGFNPWVAYQNGSYRKFL